jgi:uncharacterized protein YndB with AHSA1/START domain
VIDGDRVIHEVRYPQPVPAVWRALTDAAALASWLMPNDFVPEVGHRFRLDARPDFGVIDGEVLEVRPPSLLRCRWTVQGVPTTLTIRLEADGDGTRLELEHVRLGPDAQASFDGGWAAKLHKDIGLVLTGERDPARTTLEDGLYRHPDLEMPR